MEDQQQQKEKKKWFGPGKTIRFVLPVLILFLLGGALYLGLADSIKEEIDRQDTSKEIANAIKKYENFLSDYEKTLAEDTYGGKTPRETLDMFISALEVGNLDLAGKYFALDENLSRQYGTDGLKIASENKQILYIIGELKKAEVSKTQPGYDSAFQFVIWGEDGMVKNTIYLRLNKQSGVWKIESI